MAGIMRCAFLYPALLGLVLRFPVVFAANYFGGMWWKVSLN